MTLHSSVLSTVRTKSQCGSHLWGYYSVRSASRTMASTRILSVYPPGTTLGERVLLRLWHGWPVIGALVGIVILAATGSAVPGIVLAVGCSVAGFLVLGHATRRLRPQVRTVTVAVFYGHGRPKTHGDTRLLAESLDTLCLLEQAAKLGVVRPVDFESVWADVYAHIPADGRKGSR